MEEEEKGRKTEKGADRSAAGEKAGSADSRGVARWHGEGMEGREGVCVYSVEVEGAVERRGRVSGGRGHRLRVRGLQR